MCCQAVLVSFCVVGGRECIWIPLSIDKNLSNTDTTRQKMSVVHLAVTLRPILLFKIVNIQGKNVSLSKQFRGYSNRYCNLAIRDQVPLLRESSLLMLRNHESTLFRALKYW
jgi:hypothetical protein